MIFWNVFGTRSATSSPTTVRTTAVSTADRSAWSAFCLPGRCRHRVLSRPAGRPGRSGDWRYYSRSLGFSESETYT